MSKRRGRKRGRTEALAYKSSLTLRQLSSDRWESIVRDTRKLKRRGAHAIDGRMMLV